MRGDQSINYDEYILWYDDVSIWATIKQRNTNGNYDVDVQLYNNESKTSEYYNVELAITQDWKINTIRSIRQEKNKQLQSAQVDWELIRIEILDNDENELEVWEKLFLVKWDERILLDSIDEMHTAFGSIRASIDPELWWVRYTKSFHESFSNHIYDISKYRTIDLWPGSNEVLVDDWKYLYSCHPGSMAGDAFSLIDVTNFTPLYQSVNYWDLHVWYCMPYDSITKTVSIEGWTFEDWNWIYVYDTQNKTMEFLAKTL